MTQGPACGHRTVQECRPFEGSRSAWFLVAPVRSPVRDGKAFTRREKTVGSREDSIWSQCFRPQWPASLSTAGIRVLQALLEPPNGFAQALAQFRQILRAEYEHGDAENQQQVHRLQQPFTHLFLLPADQMRAIASPTRLNFRDADLERVNPG